MVIGELERAGGGWEGGKMRSEWDRLPEGEVRV